MDPATIFSQISSFIDPVVVFIVLVLTEVIKRLIPNQGVVGSPDVPKWVNRIMPMVPLILGMITICIKFKCYPSADLMIKGLISGAIAAYVYRTYKVLILGD